MKSTFNDIKKYVNELKKKLVQNTKIKSKFNDTKKYVSELKNKLVKKKIHLLMTHSFLFCVGFYFGRHFVEFPGLLFMSKSVIAHWCKFYCT